MKKKYRNTTHHRKPRSIGGTNYWRNISEVSNLLHNSWHNLFSNKTAQEIADVINETWLDPEWELLCVRRKGYEQDKKGVL